MYLGNLLTSVGRKYQRVPVKGICFDSRKAKKNQIFFAVEGNKVSGSKFIKDAISKKVSVVVSSKKIKAHNSKVPFLRVDDVRDSLAEACSKFYTLKPTFIVAVTGTNGKSSVASFFFQLFKLNHKLAASIGTLGIESNHFKKITNLTSPDPLFLHHNLEKLKKRKINVVILEASSHGLDQKRLNYINFEAGIFTNLSRDHLDYHKNMSRYLNSKLYLFKKLLSKKSICITNEDEDFFKKLKKTLKKKKIKVNAIGKNADLRILSHRHYNSFQEVEFVYKLKKYNFRISLVGRHQINNLILAILAAEKCGLSIRQSIKKVKFIKSPEGRLECVKKLGNGARIFVDFAHTPDALNTVLKNLKLHFNSNISIVFGCGGDRDKGKRYFMGRIASKFCKKIYLTDDNPRNEDPRKIRKAIKSGISVYFKEIASRKIAIQTAIKELGSNEILLIAGKGHERYQVKGNKKIFFSDQQEIKNHFKRNNKKTKNYYWCPNITSQVFKDSYFSYKNVSIDSRNKNQGAIFFAIKGEKKDGHNYVKEALFNGATRAIIDKPLKESLDQKKVIKVPNTLIALNNLAKVTRDHSKAKIIGITGSSGKTTLKNMSSFVLKKFGDTAFSPHSFNNHYGLPLSLSNLKERDLFGVFEIGMSKKGEINSLSKILKPDIAVITNVSSAHLQNFRNEKEIANAKSEIINNLNLRSTLILNRDDKFYNYIAKKAHKKNVQVKSFGLNNNADLYLKHLKKKGNGYLITVLYNSSKYLFNITYNNRPYIQNILSTCLIMCLLNLNISNQRNIFLNFKIPGGRGDRSRIYYSNKKFVLIDESYNANPNSVRLAINNFNKIDKKHNKKILLLGDMLELGKRSKKLHRKLAKYINNSDIDKIFVLGKHVLNTFNFVKKKKQGAILNNIEDIKTMIAKYVNSDDFLMVKGSNATGLNNLCKELKKGTINAI